MVLRKFTADLREFTVDLREFTADLREFTADLRKFTAGLPGFTADLPEFTADLLKFTADMLDFTAGLCWVWPYLFAFGIKMQTKTDEKKAASKSGCPVCRPPLLRAAFSLCATCTAARYRRMVGCVFGCMSFFVVVEKEGAVGGSHKGGSYKRPRAIAPSGNCEKQRRMSFSTAPLPRATCAVAARP